jgi:pyruvate ferredoxin oxidoreductase alpha subunit
MRRIAERLSVPVMVCMDGFLLTHASERVDIPDPDQVDAFLPRYDPRQVFDPDEPVSIGAMVGPEAFTEVRYLAHERMPQALQVIPAVAAEFGTAFGRDSGGLVRPYLTEDAEIVVVALGSVLGSVKDVVDELRIGGLRVGVIGITSFRPFPDQAIRDTLTDANRHLVVLERALSPGTGGIVTADLRTALAGRPAPGMSTVVAGLGGRAVTSKSLRALLTSAAAGGLKSFTFLDLDTRSTTTTARAAACAPPSARAAPSRWNPSRPRPPHPPTHR